MTSQYHRGIFVDDGGVNCLGMAAALSETHDNCRKMVRAGNFHLLITAAYRQLFVAERWLCYRQAGFLLRDVVRYSFYCCLSSWCCRAGLVLAGIGRVRHINSGSTWQLIQPWLDDCCQFLAIRALLLGRCGLVAVRLVYRYCYGIGSGHAQSGALIMLHSVWHFAQSSDPGLFWSVATRCNLLLFGWLRFDNYGVCYMVCSKLATSLLCMVGQEVAMWKRIYFPATRGLPTVAANRIYLPLSCSRCNLAAYQANFHLTDLMEIS